MLQNLLYFMHNKIHLLGKNIKLHEMENEKNYVSMYANTEKKVNETFLKEHKTLISVVCFAE